jgi:hypothetical protein
VFGGMVGGLGGGGGGGGGDGGDNGGRILFNHVNWQRLYCSFYPL